MRTVTVEELEWYAQHADELRNDILGAFQSRSDYETQVALELSVDMADDLHKWMLKAIEQRRRALASTRSDAEADKADAKRKDV